MFCPKCGQQQATSEVRFCSRCGFQLEGVRTLVTGESRTPQPAAVPFQSSESQGESPRRCGVKHGVMLMLSTVLIVPIVVLLAKLGILHREFIPLAAIICTIGGFLRVIYALMFQSGAPSGTGRVPPAYVPPQQYVGGAHGQASALPPSSGGQPASNFGGRLFDTSDLRQPVNQPPSVTESDTKLLDEK